MFAFCCPPLPSPPEKLETKKSFKFSQTGRKNVPGDVKVRQVNLDMIVKTGQFLLILPKSLRDNTGFPLLKVD